MIETGHHPAIFSLDSCHTNKDQKNNKAKCIWKIFDKAAYVDLYLIATSKSCISEFDLAWQDLENLFPIIFRQKRWGDKMNNEVTLVETGENAQNKESVSK